jgi:hypothetical protein
MYTSIRRYNISDTGAIEEITRLVREGFVPIVSQTPGFVAYNLVDAGGGVVVSISTFDEQTGAEESNRRAANWVRENLAQFVTDSPQITAGQVLVHQTK